MRKPKMILLILGIFLIASIVLGTVQEFAPDMLWLKVVIVFVAIWGIGRIWRPKISDLDSSAKEVLPDFNFRYYVKKSLIYSLSVCLFFVLFVASYSIYLRLRYEVTRPCNDCPFVRYDTWTNKWEGIKKKQTSEKLTTSAKKESNLSEGWKLMPDDEFIEYANNQAASSQSNRTGKLK